MGANFLPILSLGSMAAGTALQAFSQIKRGSQINQAAEITAQEIEHQGTEEARQFIRRGRFAIGSQRAAYAKAGVRIEGSPMEVMFDTANEIERGTYEIGRETQTRAAVRRYEGQQAARAGQIGAASTILGGSASLYDVGTEFKKRGMFKIS